MQCASLCPRKASLEAVMCTCLRCIDPAAPGTMQIADFIIGPATLRWLGLCCVACVGVLSGLCSCRHACESVCMYRGISGMCMCVWERETEWEFRQTCPLHAWKEECGDSTWIMSRGISDWLTIIHTHNTYKYQVKHLIFQKAVWTFMTF